MHHLNDIFDSCRNLFNRSKIGREVMGQLGISSHVQV